MSRKTGQSEAKKRIQLPLESLDVSAYTVPTDFPEADGTIEWNSTTIVVVEAFAGGVSGLGYTCADVSTALLIKNLLAKLVHESRHLGSDPRPPVNQTHRISVSWPEYPHVIVR